MESCSINRFGFIQKNKNPSFQKVVAQKGDSAFKGGLLVETFAV